MICQEADERLGTGFAAETFHNYHLGRTTMSEGLVCLQRELQDKKQRCRTDLGDSLLEVRYENT